MTISLLQNRVLSEKKVTTGIPGLDSLIGGGYRKNTVNVIIGDSGCGKSTFCWQYVSQKDPNPCLFISLEQEIEQVIRESKSLGLHQFEKKYNAGMIQFHYEFGESKEETSGEIALRFLGDELPKYLNILKKKVEEYHGGLRIVIDPLTPLLFEVNEPRQQRNVLSRIFKHLREIGTAVVTVEKGFGENYTRIPTFLADSAINLDFLGLGGGLNRTLQISKFRGSSHSEVPHPLEFVKGTGLSVNSLKD